MDTIYLEKIADIPAQDAGYSVVAQTVAANQSLLFLSVHADGMNDVRASEELASGIFPKPRMPAAQRLRLTVVTNGYVVETIDIPPLDITFPNVDIFPNGKVLIAASRCECRSQTDYDLNGAVFDPITGEVRRILLGDGIQNIFIDKRGRIWASYFDEGVFGNYGWGGRGRGPVGARGLVCFSESGEKIWELPPELTMVDCYALNVWGEEVAIYFYTDFPLWRIDKDFNITGWNTDVRGATPSRIPVHKFFLPLSTMTRPRLRISGR